MQDYKNYYGCYAVYKDRKILGFYDLYTDIDIPAGQVATLVKCGNCDCWMEHKVKSFKCPKCGAVVTVSKVFDAMQDENNAFNKAWDEDYEDYY